MHPEKPPVPRYPHQLRIRINSEDEVLARANNLIVGRAAYETAVRLYPNDLIHYRHGARIIERSDSGRGRGRGRG